MDTQFQELLSKETTMKIKCKWLDSLLLQIIPSVASLYSNIAGVTSPLTIIEPANLVTLKQFFDWKKGVIYCCWHSRIYYFTYFGKGYDVFSMVSTSQDGEFIARTIQKMRMYTVRGSSTHGGKNALDCYTKIIRDGRHKAMITPDGPRGPRYKAKGGVTCLARSSGRPIVPISFSTTRGIFLPTWDLALLPLPFGKAIVTVGEPIYVSADASPQKLEELRIHVENELNRLCQQADSLCGRNPEQEVITSFCNIKLTKKQH